MKSFTFLLALLFAIQSYSQSWNQSSIVTPEQDVEAGTKRFGESVAISGNFAVIGSPKDDQVAIDAGAAYVFELSEGLWEKIAVLTASDGQTADQFGTSVSIYNDIVAVGSPGYDDEFTDQGAIYVFQKSAFGWSDTFEVQKIVAPTASSGSNFGYSVDLHKNLMIAGSHDFGSSNTSQPAILYRYDDGLFGEVAKLTPSAPSESFQFGASVDIFEDLVIIGSANAKVRSDRNQTKSFVYKKPKGGWLDTTEDAILTKSGNGRSGCLRCRFDRISVQITDSIALNSYPKLLKEDFTEFISGKVTVYSSANGEWLSDTESEIITADEETKDEAFGSSIQLSGKWLLVGNHLDSTDNKSSGKVYLYDDFAVNELDRIGLHQVLFIQNAENGDQFGFGVAIYGSSAIVGAPGKENSTGAAYFFSSNEAYVKSVFAAQEGTYITRDTLLIDILFDREVVVEGEPKLILSLNDSTYKKASYKQQIEPHKVRMYYVVEDGDISHSVDYLNENSFLYGGTVLDAESIRSNRVLPPIGAEESLGVSSNISIDADKPFAFFSGPTATNGSLDIQIDFSRQIDEITIDDLAIINGTILSSDIRNDTIFASIQPDAEGKVIVYYSDGAFSDLRGTPNDSVAFVIEYDLTAPEISIISEANEIINGAFEISIAFSEQIDFIDQTDIGLVNATIENFTVLEDTVHFVVAPIEEGVVALYYSETQVFDLAGNGNDSTSFSIIFDETPPEISISSEANNYVNSTFEVSIAFSEQIDMIDENDIELENATIENFTVLADTANILILPTDEGIIKLFYSEGQVMDLAGNGNDSTTFSIIYDNTPPETSIISEVDDYVNSPFEVSVAFSEQITDIDQNDIQLENATISDFIVLNDTVHFLVHPVVEETVSVEIPEDVVFDIAGNSATSSIISIEYDITAPVIEVDFRDGKVTDEIFVIAFSFSESVIAFDEMDIQTENLLVQEFNKTNDSLYHLVMRRLDFGVVSIVVDPNSYRDLAGNSNNQTLEIRQLVLSSSEQIDGVLIYPIPAKDYVQVDVGDLSTGKKDLHVFSIDGKLMYQDSLTGSRIKLDLRKLKDGLYTLLIINKTNIISRRILIER